MKTAKLREAFLKYFDDKGHTRVPSSSLIPIDDPTLLFTNAGMVQFKQTFLGTEAREYTRATSSQKCVRAGGKHNDLEKVGFTARHHTFFEMLGNFSFGDYFKKEAIEYAWEFVTEVLKLPKERLWITVYKDDLEAEKIWLDHIGIDPKSFSRCGDKDNFWSMGDTGPCGPCTEIFYDHGPEIPGGPPGSPDEEGDRYIEIWNLVFMQYNRDASGKLTDLPKPSVDTGMGLERVAAIMQGKHNNYDIDLFQNIIKEIAAIAKTKDLGNKSLRVIADHLRSCAFLVADGVVPSNEKRGYVLRRIMRRAIRHGRKLGIVDTFFYKLVDVLVDEMGDAFPELRDKKKIIKKVFEDEESKFNVTLEVGLSMLERELLHAEKNSSVVPGEVVFKLYDTCGFPVDLTADIAREYGLEIDIAGYEKLMSQQKARSKQSSNFNMQESSFMPTTKTKFTGYKETASKAKIVEMFNEDTAEETILILDETPFYAEQGGQVGDTGVFYGDDGAEFLVQNTIKMADAHVHIGTIVKGNFKIGDKVSAEINVLRREKIKANHSATHLLHAALHQILGDHAQQKGSVVDPERLRFDFSNPRPLTVEEIEKIEDIVNKQVLNNLGAEVKEMSLDDAKKLGALAFFGEKYGKKVRVLNIGDGFSVELCGGTHTERTGDIGLFKIVSESGVAAGIRRIEAVTGYGAIEWVRTRERALQLQEEEFKQKYKKLEKEYKQIKQQLASGKARDLASEAREIKGIKVLSAELPVADPVALREAVDRFKNQFGTAIIVLAGTEDQKVNLVVGVTKDCISKIKAGELISSIAAQVGGKGGGRPDLAQAGGNQPENLQKALDSVFDWVAERL